MCDLISLSSSCGKTHRPGTKTKLYFTCSCELADWPAIGTTGADKKEFTEAFDFTGAPTGKGFWREADILVNTGNISYNLEGELGGQGYKNSVTFFISGSDKEQLHFADQIRETSGFLVVMLADKKGQLRVIGSKEEPARVETAEGATGLTNGERNGTAYTVSDDIGLTAPIYPNSLGVDLIPNT